MHKTLSSLISSKQGPPPSMTYSQPVTNDESSLARYTANFATSSAEPNLPEGTLSANIFFAASAPILAFLFILSLREGVSIVPGWMQLHLTLYFEKSAATLLVKPTTAALDA